MLQYSTYSVISPEGCASILWKSAERAADAADAMGITAPRLAEAGIVDAVVKEPLGGAHRDYAATAEALKAKIVEQLSQLEQLDTEQLLSQRQARLRGFGFFQ